MNLLATYIEVNDILGKGLAEACCLSKVKSISLEPIVYSLCWASSLTICTVRAHDYDFRIHT